MTVIKGTDYDLMIPTPCCHICIQATSNVKFVLPAPVQLHVCVDVTSELSITQPRLEFQHLIW